MKHVEFYRNNIDGKVLVLTGGQAPESVVYDGQELTHLVAGSVDAAQENTYRLSRKLMDTWKSTSAPLPIPWKKSIISNGLPWSMTVASTSTT